MQQLFQALYSGVLSGAVYALMAIGITLVWSSLRTINLSYGAIYVAGAYAAWWVLNDLNLPLYLALPFGVLASAALGYILHRLLWNRIVGTASWDYAPLIVAVGYSMILENIILLLFGPRAKEMPLLLEGSVKYGTLLITHQALVVIGISVIILVLVNYFLEHSRQGMAIQAVSQNISATQLMGVPVKRVFLSVMAISGALAGLTSVLLSAILFFSPSAGYSPMLKGLVVAIFGGIGSVRGTIAAAYLIGLLEAFIAVYLGSSWALPLIFLFTILLLIVRPSGLFGIREVIRL